MRSAVRSVILGLIALLTLPFVSFGVYDIVAFQSRRGNIEKLLALATQDERRPTKSLKQLFRISSNDNTAAFAARVLVRDLPIETKRKLEWHSINILWCGLVALHLSEDEQIALLASRSYMGSKHYGFSAESLARFGRPLSTLNQEEEATLVALSQAPSLYVGSPELLVERKERLLRELHNGL